ncbi:MAG: tetratricopeptide repeat protein [Balneolales bacterium]
MNIQNIKFYLLTAFAVLMVGCAASDPNIESAKTHITLTNYEGAIEAANEAIEANPENGDGYYYKAVAQSNMAFNRPPEERTPLYSQARENFDRAKELYDAAGQSGGEASEMSDYIIDIWGQEHNLGIELIEEDFVSTDEDSLRLAEHHLNNATTINPDSAQTFNILYEVNYLLGDLDQAIENAEHVVMGLGSDDLYNYYRLSYFYQEREDYESALTVLEAARNDHPENTEVIQELANLYLSMGDTDRALETVQRLIDSDPQNPQYRLVYGTQVYQLVLNMDEDMSQYHDELFEITQAVREERRQANPDERRIAELEQRADQLNSQIDELQEEIDRFADRAEEELQQAVELEPDNPVTHTTLGIIYQNRAATLYERRNATDDLELAQELDDEAREVLQIALPYYERAAELQPDNEENWLALFRVYTQLGMTEEAEDAQEKAGL